MWDIFLAVMSDASCQDLLAFSVISGGGETECIHGSVRCLAVKVTGRGCLLPLDPLHVQISKIQMAIGREENTVETCSEQVYRSQEALTKAQDHLWEIQGRLEQVAIRTRRRTKGMLLWLFRMVLALGGMQTHQAPTTSKDMTHQQKQSVSVEGCGSAVIDSVGCE